MKRIVKNLIASLSSNTWAQLFLERNLTMLEYLMGIGSGSDVDSSGEKVLADELKQLHNQTRKSLCVFDVGSNKGQFLRMIVDGLQNIPFELHAFEPGRQTFNKLSDNAKGFSNVRLNNFGLGKESGEFELYYDNFESGMASMSKRRLDHFGVDFRYSEQIKIDTLDNYCSNNKVQNIDLLKIDVEGHELDVLNGGIQMLKSKKIKIISFEFLWL